MVVSRRQNIFTVLGAVLRTGPYAIARKDMRMLEALGYAGDVLSPTCKYIFLIRPVPAIKQVSAEANAELAPPGPGEQLGPLPQPLRPGEIPTSATAPTTQGALEELRNLGTGAGKAPAPPAPPAPSIVPRFSQVAGAASAAGAEEPQPAAGKGPRWTYDKVKQLWVPVDQETSAPATPTAPVRAPSSARGPSSSATLAALKAVDANNPFEVWSQMEKGGGSRVIVITYSLLVNGDFRSNVVIRENDVIYVPRDVTGEFYVGGEVARPGVYSLTGRNITVKMAMVAAGNLNATAWPKNSILIRRIGEKQEQVIPLDIEKIWFGQSPDIFLKPDDVIAVGSNWRQPWLAIFRNAFRFSYGAGFVYDRNFDAVAPGSAGLDSRRFTRW
jgi:protein involved in polysaccharide export with SLBB domain